MDIAGMLTGLKPGEAVARLELHLQQGVLDKNSYYDSLTDLVMRRVLGTHSVCIDVGCHRGTILRLMMKYSPQGRFLAFEPLPDLWRDLLTDFPFENVQFYNLALSDTTGVSSFNYVISNPGYSGLKRRRYDRPHETDTQIEVKTDTLDNILATRPVEHLTFIKIDVEGAEWHVLKGAVSSIKNHRPVIVFEHGIGGADCYGNTPQDVYRLLCGDCGLRISLLSAWLQEEAALDLDGFCEQYYEKKNYYFMAHP